MKRQQHLRMSLVYRDLVDHYKSILAAGGTLSAKEQKHYEECLSYSSQHRTTGE